MASAWSPGPGSGIADTNRDGRLPLHHAALADDIGQVDAQLATGDDPNLGDSKDGSQCTSRRSRALSARPGVS